MYIQTRTYSPSTHRFGFFAAYRILRERNFFGVLASLRYAYWLAYGNEMMPPGEMRAWFREQYAKHPHAFGVLFIVWAYAIIVFVMWTVTR